MYVTKPYQFIWFGDIHGSKPYKLQVHRVTMGVYFADTGIASRRDHPCTVCFWNQGTPPMPLVKNQTWRKRPTAPKVAQLIQVGGQP
jgi:hypothetical protein